jgi:predicted metal-dependent peptidase
MSCEIEDGLYLPSADKKPAMGTMVVQIDESGSIGNDELAHFAGHLNKMLETCTPERLIVLHTDTRVAKVEEFTVEDFPVKLKSYAGGGKMNVAGYAMGGKLKDYFKKMKK